MLDRLRTLLIVRIIITPRGPIPGSGSPDPFVGVMAGLVGLGSQLSQVNKRVQG